MKTRTAVMAALVATTLGVTVPARATDTLEAVEQLATQIAAAAPDGKQVRIAVTDFADSQGVISDYSRYVADRLILRLARNQRLMAIERRFLGVVLEQLKLKRSDLAKPENARLLAKEFGADIVVLGSMTDLGNQITLEAKVVDILTNDTLGFASAEVTKDSKVTRMLEGGRQ